MSVPAEQMVANHWVGDGFLASFPRSGSSLSRLVLHHKFGLNTASVYDESKLSESAQDTMGQIEHGKPYPVPLLWKWHGSPNQELDVKCLIVHRDARDVFRSLDVFYKNNNEKQYSMTDLILGRHPWGDWSKWVRNWVRYAPGDSFWISYSDLVNGYLDQLSGWLDRPVLNNDIPSIDELRAKEARVFNKGGEHGSLGMTYAERKLFWERHGSVMSLLGYS